MGRSLTIFLEPLIRFEEEAVRGDPIPPLVPRPPVMDKDIEVPTGLPSGCLEEPSIVVDGVGGAEGSNPRLEEL